MPGRKKSETPKAGRAAKDAKAPVSAGKKRQAQEPTSAYESLTPRDQKFVDLFIATSQKANSAIEAGYAPRSAHAIISRKLKTDQFAQAIAERRAALHTRLNVAQADMARPLLTIANTGMSKFVRLTSDGDPRSFYVYPGNTGSGIIEARVAALPAELPDGADPDDAATFTAAISTPDIYEQALIDYVLYRAYAMDMNIVGGAQRATFHLQQFANSLGIKLRGELAANPDTKRTSRGRIDPLIEDSPALKERVSPARSRDAGNSMLSKEFPGGILVLTGANSATGLRSMPARYVFLDEVDAYPASADEEGDPVTLAEARTTTFAHRRKVFMVSTPTIRGLSRIEREFEASDQRRYFVPCPHCGHKQWLRFERLRWDKGRPDTAVYHCAGCEKPIAEHHKTEMLARGEWRATAVSSNPNAIGFHLSALYSPIGWKSWEQIARDWLAAQGSDEMLRAARNTLLGETWTESGEAPEWQRLADRRVAFAAQIPAGGLFLTAGADVQKDRIEVDIWAWGRGLESWLVDHIVIPGGPDDPACWDRLTALLGQTWAHEKGAIMTLATVGAAGVEVAQEVLAQTQSAILPLVAYLDTLRWVFIALALGGIAVAIYARLDDWHRGQR